MNQKLLSELKSIVGSKWVLTQPGDLHVYSMDSALDRGRPSAVVLPATPGQVGKVIQALAKSKTAYVARGAATSLCGGPVAQREAVVIGLTRLKTIGKLNQAQSEITVEPGVVNLKLQQAVAPSNLFFAPDPGSQKACTIGGNVSTNAGGPHCLKYGVTSNHVSGVEFVLPDGSHSRFSTKDPGYDLVGLLVGSEGTLGTVTRATLKLLPTPKSVRTMVVSFPSIETAIQSVTDIIRSGILPATLEAMDKTVVQAVEGFVHAGYPTDAEAVLLIEVDGDSQDKLDQEMGKIKEICQNNSSMEVRIAQDEAERQKLWEGRRGSYAAMARLAPNVLVEDGAVPRTKLPEALQKMKEIAQAHNIKVALLFHAGDGNLHPQIIFDERDEQHTKVVKQAGHQMLKACVDLGGTISGEHGIGTDKREAMKWLFTRETLSLFRRIKKAFDPENICNPDKLIPLVSKGSHANDLTEEQINDYNQMGVTAPSEEKEVINLVKAWALRKRRFGIQCHQTKFLSTEPSNLGLQNLNQILDLDKGNLTLKVQAGASLASVRSEVEKEGLYLWVAGEGSVGGAIATRESGIPPVRDMILAMTVLLPNGDVARLGANTMKNVAGYDAAKLLIGSWGTLGIILDVTFKLFSFPAEQLRTQPVRPFVLSALHKKIKLAFDPDQILSQRLSNFTKEDVAKYGPPDASKQTSSVANEDEIMKKMKDKFWS